MGRLTQAIIAALQADAPQDWDDTVRIAGDLMAKARNTGEYRSEFVDVDAEEITEQENEDLKCAVAEALQRETDLRRCASLLWALGKSGDSAYTDLYLSHLQRFAETVLSANAGLHQTLVALDSVGEDVFERNAQGGESQGLTEVEHNLRQARGFLRRNNCLIPW